MQEEMRNKKDRLNCSWMTKQGRRGKKPASRRSRREKKALEKQRGKRDIAVHLVSEAYREVRRRDSFEVQDQFNREGDSCMPL